jgi:ABC-type transport system substrate-binding protein
MKKLTTSLLLVVGALCAATSLAAQPAPAAKMASTGGKSPHETFGVVLGPRATGNRVTITYGRPFAKERKIYGGLVPWDKADRLGSDEATLLLLQKPLMIGDAKLPAGAYTLYLVPSETGASKLAISSNIGKWGIPVDEKSDVARVELKKAALDNHVEQLTLAIEKDQADGGVLKISWEKTQFSVALAAVK